MTTPHTSDMTRRPYPRDSGGIDRSTHRCLAIGRFDPRDVNAGGALDVQVWPFDVRYVESIPDHLGISERTRPTEPAVGSQIHTRVSMPIGESPRLTSPTLGLGSLRVSGACFPSREYCGSRSRSSPYPVPNVRCSRRVLFVIGLVTAVLASAEFWTVT